MALRILFRPTGLVLSSAIGNIGIETDAESMDVVLKDSDGHILLQERYFSFNGMLMDAVALLGVGKFMVDVWCCGEC